MPANTVASCVQAVPHQQTVVLKCKAIVTGGGNQVEPTTGPGAVSGALKASHEEALEDGEIHRGGIQRIRAVKMKGAPESTEGKETVFLLHRRGLTFFFNLMRVLFLDPSHGATSAMLIGALSDAGLKPSAIEWELSNIDLGDFHMHFDRKERDGQSGIAFTLHSGAHHGHGDCCGGDHDHDEAPRTLANLRDLISSSELSDRVKATTLGVIERLATAEAIPQGTSPETARLYEAETTEGLLHLVILAVGLEALAIEKVVVAPLKEGKGWVQNASGSREIPSPVTLALLKDAPLELTNEPFQLLAPLPAAMLAEIATEYGDRPAFSGETTCGWGISTRRFPPFPSVVSAEIGEV